MPTFGKQENNAVGALVADAFHWAMGDLAAEDGYTGHTVAVTADGVLRAAILAGEVTASEAFDVLSMGVGEDGTSGFPLVSVYLTGKEIKAAMEVDASVTPIMPAAQLYMSGVHYSFNTHRMFFNRVTRSTFDEPGYLNGFQSHTLTKIEDGELYRVVTGMYSAQMLSTVKEKSMGLLSLVPKDAQGQPITDFTKHIVYDQDGNELKEWYALAAYLQSFGEDGIHDWYAIQNASIGAKSVSDSWNILEHLVNWNWITWAVLGVILLAILLVVLILRVIRYFWRKRRSA
jgi:2',3'-cyclic-nucleotide 2'-phosphodiesterase (5'-nucleotidase family)